MPDGVDPGRDFAASQALASRPNDDWIKALASGQGATGTPAGATGTPAAATGTATAGAAPVRDASQPVGQAMADGSRDGAAPGILRNIWNAATAGPSDALSELAALPGAAAKQTTTLQPDTADFAQPMKWSDLASPSVALPKAIYAIGHGAPVIASGLAGLFGGAALGSAVPAIGNVAGGIAGGAIGAGAMSAAQSLAPHLREELRTGASPEDAFNQALAKAGQDGAFTAAGWALFGWSPFRSAVQKLLFQAFYVQPAVGIAQRATENVESGRPIAEGLNEGVPGAIVGTVLPAAAHAAFHAAMPGAAPDAGAGGGAGETPAPYAPEAPKPVGAGLEALDPASVKVDAQRFQFKAGGDEAGVTDRLAGVTKWDPHLAGTALVWRDTDGQDWVADGHQRLGLAQRLQGEGQPDIRLNAFVLDAADGVSAEQARTIAAYKNIAEGSGTPLDAAKVFRQAAADGTELPPLPPRSALVRDGQALSKLGDDAFGMAVNEVVPFNQAAAVGRLVSDPAQQTEAMRLLAAAKPENANQADLLIRDMLATGTTDATQMTLFGPEHFASSVVLERAKVLDEAGRALARDRGTFRVLVQRADDIAAAGNTLAGDTNQARLTTDEQASQLLNTLGTTRGPVSDQLTAIARDFKSGTITRAEAGRRFLGAVRGAIESGLPTGDVAGGAEPGAATAGTDGVAPGQTGTTPAAGEAPAADAGQGGLFPPEPPEAGAAAAEPPGWQDHFANLPQSDETAPTPAVSVDGQPWDRLQSTPELGAKVLAFLNGESGDNPVQASLEGLARDPDLNSWAVRIAAFVPREGVKSDDSLRLAAYGLGLQPEEAGALLKGRGISDDQMGAVAMLVNSAGAEAHRLAKIAVESGRQEDLTAATRAITLNLRLLEDWSSAGTEMGRAFRARQLAWDARTDLTRQLQNIIANVDGENITEVVREVAGLNDPAQVSPFLNALRRMTGRDGILYFWYNMLLSNPKTVIKKTISDTSMAAFNLGSRYLAEKGPGAGIAPGEAGALLAGYMGSWTDAFRAAGKALAAGQSQFLPDNSSLDGYTTTGRISALANGLGDVPTSPTLSGWALIRSAMPTSWIGAADDFFKTMHYRAELQGLAWRQAWKDGLTGQAQSDRVGELLANVPRDMHEQAVARALELTFQEPLDGRIAGGVRDLADSMNVRIHGMPFEVPVGRMILPFVRVPANILATAYRMTPLPLVFDNAAVRADLAAGGARRATRMAQIGLGTGLSMLGAGMAASGSMTGQGPSQPEMRRAWLAAGNQPYSVKFGDTWYSYRQIEPAGVLLGTIADTADLMRYAKDEDAAQMAMSVVFGVGNALLSASYLQGAAGFLEALHQPEGEAPRYLQQQVTSMAVPRLASGIEAATDDWRRAHYNLLQGIEANIPWVAQGLPPQRNIWGDAMPTKDAFMPFASGSGAARMLSPIPMQEAAPGRPIDKWIWDHREAFPNAEDGKLGFYSFKPTQHFSDGRGAATQVQLDPKQLDRLRDLAGNALKDPKTGLGLADALDGLVQGNYPDATSQKRWNGAPPEAQALAALRMVQRTREAAKHQLVNEDPGLAEKVLAGWSARRAALSGQAAPGTTAAASPAMPALQ